jgi:hypothetical protein
MVVRSALLSVLVVAASSAAVPAANAAADRISLSVAADPVETIATQISAGGYATNGNEAADVIVESRPTGGGPCGANPRANDGRPVLQHSVSHDFDLEANYTFDRAGSYLLCGWIFDYTQDKVVATASLEVAVRLPNMSLALTAPGSVIVGEGFDVVVAAQTEGTRTVDVEIVPDDGRGCPANTRAAAAVWDSRTVVDGWIVQGAPAPWVQPWSIPNAGSYRLCGYFRRERDDPPQVTALARIAAQPPCVVPEVTRGSRLTVVKRSIVASGCTVGKVTKRRSRRYRRGRVVSVAPRAGTRLAPLAPVNVVVSKGRRRR